MKSFFLIATTLLSTSVLAQSSAASGGQGGGQVLPTCAQPCALKAIQNSKCGSTDPACVCKTPGFAEAYVSCVNSGCNPTDAAAAISAGIQLCTAAGVTIGSVSGLPSATAAGSASTYQPPAPPSSAPVVPPPPVVPSQPAPAPPATPTAPAPAPVPATPSPVVPTAGAGMLSAHGAGVVSMGLAWLSIMFFVFLV
ncbi:hypothetical protein NW762_008326 [Fusarium torreyae]|uniref:CFEM domain-containing protein n=1 Tax=Fusarium torreyae TaxID=1237075 RepID=A0A9W8RZA2_9HYPO|nr:hypothetical protein NW762_008326 [Fusarium torreyae]